MPEGRLQEELEALAARLGGLDLVEGVRRDHPVGPLTTYRVGGAAAVFVRPVDRDELRAIATATAGGPVPVAMVGRGSNLLVADGGYAGLVLQLGGGFDAVEVDGTRIVAGGGASLPVVARHSVQEGLAGFEWAVGVPGSIGGAVRMNAGGHGSDMSAVLESADVVDLSDGTDRRQSLDDLALGYRTSSITSTQVVVSASLGLRPGDPAEGESLLAEIVRWRRENQPGGTNAGSVFTNPAGDSAGRLIDLAGLKGLRHGSAVVSTKHANFIQADPGGRAGDVLALMREVQRRVAEAHGVDLHPETVLLGFDS